ncbi:MAG: DUF721 domain-containing protein [Longimicrobiales bacterium]
MRIGEAVAAYLRRAGLAERVDEAGAIPDWNRRVGARIAEVTRPVTVSSGVLIVAVRSSPWLMELKLMEHEILRRLNAGRSFGKIDRIHFVMDEENGRQTGTSGS